MAHDPLARAGLAALLAGQPGCTVVGQIAGDADLPGALEAYRPDVVLWDLGWNVLLALEGLINLRDTSSPTLALVPDAAHASEAWAAGPRGLLAPRYEWGNLAGGSEGRFRGADGARPRAFRRSITHHRPRAGIIVGRANLPLTGGAATPGRRAAQQVHRPATGHQRAHRQVPCQRHSGKLGAQSRTEAVTRATRLGLIFL